jgi:nucleoid-associated protein YgaU
MALAPLEITPLSKEGKPNEKETLRVLFNPNTYSVTKSVKWEPPPPPEKQEAGTNQKFNAPQLVFGGGDCRLLTMELFYDVTEHPQIDDVRKETNRIVKLTRIDKKLKEPPVVLVGWGAKPPEDSDFPFTGVITQLTQRFTLFRADGRPVRATLNVTFKEFLTRKKAQEEVDPEFTTRLVKRGDTLSNIAAEIYNDPTQWRVIAEANNLDDPRHLEVGARLAIPKLG